MHKPYLLCQELHGVLITGSFRSRQNYTWVARVESNGGNTPGLTSRLGVMAGPGLSDGCRPRRPARDEMLFPQQYLTPAYKGSPWLETRAARNPRQIPHECMLTMADMSNSVRVDMQASDIAWIYAEPKTYWIAQVDMVTVPASRFQGWLSYMYRQPALRQNIASPTTRCDSRGPATATFCPLHISSTCTAITSTIL